MNRRELITMAGLAGISWALPWRTSWAAPGAPGGALRLVFFSDVHARTEWDTPLALAQAAAAINQQRPDLIIAGGDLITDGFQSAASVVEPRWKAYMGLHNALEAPFYPALGNHDLVAAMPEDGSKASKNPRQQFCQKHGLERTYRSFAAGGYHFFLLDSVMVTYDELKYNGRIDNPQLSWLREELASIKPGTPLVVVTHLPLLTAFYQATEGALGAATANRVVTNNREVLELFSGHNLLLVLQGHLHVDEMLRWQKTTFITGGALCGKWWRGDWQGTPPGFGVLTLSASKVDWEYFDYGWKARRP